MRDRGSSNNIGQLYRQESTGLYLYNLIRPRFRFSCTVVVSRSKLDWEAKLNSLKYMSVIKMIRQCSLLSRLHIIFVIYVNGALGEALTGVVSVKYGLYVRLPKIDFPVMPALAML
jgi:hypothetical protein